MSTRRKALMGIVGGAVTLGAGGFATVARSQEGPVRFGGSLGVSGRYAETGLNIKMGYETAIKYINEVRGGVDIGGRKVPVSLNLVDDSSDPSRATTLIQRQVDSGIDFFLGSYGSNVVLPCAAITEAAGKPMMQVGASADQIFLQGHKHVFGFFPRASRAWESSVAFLQSINPKPKKISIIATNDAFSKLNAEAAAKGCRAAGFEVLDVIQLPEQVSDASSALATIRSRQPDVLITTTVDQNSLVIARQMLATNTSVPLLYQFLGPQLPMFRDSLGAKSAGILAQFYWDERVNSNDPVFGNSKTFVEYYNKNNTRPLSYHTAAAASCISSYVHAIQSTKSADPKKVRDAIAAMDISTVFGRVKFTPEGDGDPIVMGAKIGQVQNGKFEVVYPTQQQTAKLIYPTPAWDKK
ncbi:MAG: amino acid ABC transporter substrate-binding protein [Pseudomonadota bacterium]